jgi:hypothetical protein
MGLCDLIDPEAYTIIPEVTGVAGQPVFVEPIVQRAQTEASGVIVTPPASVVTAAPVKAIEQFHVQRAVSAQDSSAEQLNADATTAETRVHLGFLAMSAVQTTVATIREQHGRIRSGAERFAGKMWSYLGSVATAPSTIMSEIAQRAHDTSRALAPDHDFSRVQLTQRRRRASRVHTG